jgi:hypothetical protein
MGEALEAVLECFAGRRSAQGDPKRHRFAVLPSREEPRYLLPLGLKALVTNVTGERNPAFAMILGKPGKYRKLTIQVMRSGGETLGYIKLGLTKPAGGRVRHEARLLEDLAALRPRVPHVLYSGEWQESYLLFLSPLEGQPGPSELSGMHMQFLDSLARCRKSRRT